MHRNDGSIGIGESRYNRVYLEAFTTGKGKQGKL
jgi:hypothetical protein